MWCLSKDARQRPSDIIRLNDHIRDEFGFDGLWWCIQFDKAIYWAGNYIESKLHEVDKRGRHKYKLKDLLTEHTGSLVDMFRNANLSNIQVMDYRQAK